MINALPLKIQSNEETSNMFLDESVFYFLGMDGQLIHPGWHKFGRVLVN